MEQSSVGNPRQTSASSPIALRGVLSLKRLRAVLSIHRKVFFRRRKRQLFGGHYLALKVLLYFTFASAILRPLTDRLLCHRSFFSCKDNTLNCCCCCCCCCLHIKSRSGLYSVLSNIRTGPTDADAFRGHRLTTQKGYTYQKEIKGPGKVNTHAIIGK